MRGLATLTVAGVLLAGCAQAREADPPVAAPPPSPEAAGALETPDEASEAPAATPSPSSEPPVFLDPARVAPTVPGGWRTGGPTTPLRCLAEVDLRGGERFEHAYSGESSLARQTVVRLGSAAQARALFDDAVRAVAGCAAGDLAPAEGGSAEFEDRGFLDVGEETRFFRIRSGRSEADGRIVFLFALYRDGNTFAVFAMDDPPGDSPEDDFALTAARALDLL
ncbi:MAG: hypothetical protein ACT4QF_08070 [Sporichthyaceae bacterium]